jgi:tetratricopeptide (TPR) repeat protein
MAEHQRLSMPQKKYVRDCRFRLALEQGYFETSESLAEDASQWANYWLERQRYYLNRDLTKAKECAQQALDIAKEANLLRQKAYAERALGFVCRELGQLDEAIQWYQHCKKTSLNLAEKEGARLYGFAQNNEGYIWALIGDYEQARETVRNALIVRKRHGSDYEMAQSLSTLGEIERFSGRLRQAGDYYRRALDIFHRLKAYDWEAIQWHQRAENARRVAQEERLYEFSDEDRIDKYMGYALVDIGESLKLYDRYHLSRDRQRAWRRYGEILGDFGRLDEAKDSLLTALRLSNESHNQQEALESLITLAELSIRQENYDEAENYLQDIDTYEDAFHYDVYEGLRDVYRGKSLLARHKFDAASKTYINGLVKLAKQPGYGHARLDTQLSGLRDLLNTLPSGHRRSWCKTLLWRWEKEALEDKAPRLPRVVNRYMETLALTSAQNAPG